MSGALLLTLPYALLRLADDFTGVRTWIRRLAEGGLAASFGITFVFEEPAPDPATLVMLTYFLATTAPDPLHEDTTLAAIAFRSGRAIFSEDPTRDDPDNAELYRRMPSLWRRSRLQANGSA